MEGVVDDENLIVDATALTDFKTYLLNVCVLMFSSSTDSVLDSFENDENSTILSSFVGNPDVMCLFVSTTRDRSAAGTNTKYMFCLYCVV